MKIDRVLISAGIHGNEKTPIFLLEKLQRRNIISRSNFKTETLIANPQAVKLNRRYVDIDLNRCFHAETLNNPEPIYYEEAIAQEIYRQIKLSAADFILDCHTSSSNMELTLLISSDRPFNLQLAAYLAEKNPLVRIVRTANNNDKNRLRHLFDLGFTLEIGAISPNVIDAIWVRRAEKLIADILDYIEQTNNNQQPEFPDRITIYSLIEPVYFPTSDRGEIEAMIHPELQGNDYLLLKKGQPIFIDLDNNIITYQGETRAAIFISEAAYFESKIAFYLAKKEEITIISQ